MEQDEMTTAELTVLLKTLGKLVEVTAKGPTNAARIIREAIPNKSPEPSKVQGV